MDILERAMQYNRMIESVQPELSRLERASRVLAVLEMERKQAVSQRVSESVHQGGVLSGRGGGASVSHESPDKHTAFRALVKRSPHMSTRAIASAIGISQSTASRWKRQMKHFETVP